MAERKRSRRRRDETNVDNGASQDKPSKDEYAVAKWIRDNVPSKKTKFDRNHNVEYFTGSRAVDALLQNSPWSKNRFETREQVTAFLNTMLRHKFFHRAKKVVIPEEELVRIRSSRKKAKELKDDKKSFEKDDLKDNEGGGGQNSGRDSGRENEDKNEDRRDVKSHEHKKAPKVRLEMHMDQYFVDCNDAYVWIYESTPITYWFFGTCVVFAAIGICLFPLWPTAIRHGVYYLSVAAAGFLVLILALAILRMIVFCLLWLPTLGRCHLWLLPNLTADVGFFASFWPLYQYEYHGPVTDPDKKTSKKKRKKSKDSDTEEPSSSMPTPSPSHKPSSQPQPSPKGKSSLNEPLEEAEKVFNADDMKEGGSPIESPTECAEDGSESSESDKSNTGKDFVMV